MVKSKEIMLGNWFFVGSGTDWKERLQVDEVFENSVSFKGREFMTYITSIEPIPITRQLLERNGFFEYTIPKDVKNDCICYNVFYILTNEYKLEITHWDEEDEDWDIQIYNSKQMYLGGCIIKHIHQLQNFLNLCGLDLEIKV
jgi:hypothetical protein